MCPAVGQGAIGLEIRSDDDFMLDACRRLADLETMACVTAERVVMRTLEGGCQVPIGAYCRFEDDMLVMDGVVASIDGTNMVRYRLEGSPAAPEMLGAMMVDHLLDLGAAEILAEVRAASGGSVSSLLEN
jgi:hydroxymethylbilane synthase